MIDITNGASFERQKQILALEDVAMNMVEHPHQPTDEERHTVWAGRPRNEDNDVTFFLAAVLEDYYHVGKWLAGCYGRNGNADASGKPYDIAYLLETLDGTVASLARALGLDAVPEPNDEGDEGAFDLLVAVTQIADELLGKDADEEIVATIEKAEKYIARRMGGNVPW